MSDCVLQYHSGVCTFSIDTPALKRDYSVTLSENRIDMTTEGGGDLYHNLSRTIYLAMITAVFYMEDIDVCTIAADLMKEIDLGGDSDVILSSRRLIRCTTAAEMCLRNGGISFAKISAQTEGGKLIEYYNMIFE